MKANEHKNQPPVGLPVLTEVVVMDEVDDDLDAVIDAAHGLSGDDTFEVTQPAALDMGLVDDGEELHAHVSTEVLSEQLIVERVLADLDKQVDLMFEHRLRETLAPVLARMTDTLVREMRNQLAVSLREMVERAVSLELDRHHKR